MVIKKRTTVNILAKIFACTYVLVYIPTGKCVESYGKNMFKQLRMAKLFFKVTVSFAFSSATSERFSFSKSSLVPAIFSLFSYS